MNGRLLTSLIAAALLTFAGTNALAAAITPHQLPVIATVVAHAHAHTQAYVPYTHGL